MQLFVTLVTLNINRGVTLNWLVFTYSLPSKASSSPRVALWRRLRRTGAIALGGVQVLPSRDDTLEALKWLAQEVQHANGEALVMHVEAFEGMSDQTVIKKFREARQEDYADLIVKITDLENTLTSSGEGDRTPVRDSLEKLYKHHAEIRQIDFFGCPEQDIVATRLNQLSQAILPPVPSVTIIPRAIEDYQDTRWVTRPRPHVDRLACIWLIRRFINPQAVIRYRKTAQASEVPFDMDRGEFRHQGNLCTFEVMVQSFRLQDPGLQTIGEIVHEIDLRDGLYLHPQIAGIEALLRGWLLADFPDEELESHGIALFEGLYVACLKDTPQITTKPTHAPKKR